MIVSEKEFVEISRMGNKYIKHTIKAVQYPEIIRIQDMLNCENQIWEEISENDYMEINRLL